jgi:hypothetical protein
VRILGIGKLIGSLAAHLGWWASWQLRARPTDGSRVQGGIAARRAP